MVGFSVSGELHFMTLPACLKNTEQAIHDFTILLLHASIGKVNQFLDLMYV